MSGRGVWIIIGIIGLMTIILMLNHDSGTVLGMRTDGVASMAFYGIWAAVIGAAIIPRSGGLKQAARNGAIWLVFIMMLMAGYVYRYELQDIGSRLTAGLIPGSPLSSQSAEGRDQITIIRAENGHFEADMMVNGVDVRFLVDTGASSIVLSHEDAQKAGIDTGRLNYSIEVSTANGKAFSALTRIALIQLGSIEQRNIRALVAQPGALDGSLLGMSFLERLWSFEVRGDRLILTK